MSAVHLGCHGSGELAALLCGLAARLALRAIRQQLDAEIGGGVAQGLKTGVSRRLLLATLLLHLRVLWARLRGNGLILAQQLEVTKLEPLDALHLE